MHSFQIKETKFFAHIAEKKLKLFFSLLVTFETEIIIS